MQSAAVPFLLARQRKALTVKSICPVRKPALGAEWVKVKKFVDHSTARCLLFAVCIEAQSQGLVLTGEDGLGRSASSNSRHAHSR